MNECSRQTDREEPSVWAVRRWAFSAIFGVLSLVPGAALPEPAPTSSTAPVARYPGPISEKTFAIMRNAREILIYTYPEKVGGLDPARDHTSMRRVADLGLIYRFQGLLEQNAVFQPAYRKRCMPVWDFGVEFRAAGDKRTFLFSFRCNTMMVHEENIFRDFERERVGIYALLRYEVNAATTD